MQESRLFQIVYCLLEQGQATAPELAAKLEVSVRTIYRDMDALSAAGIPIYAQAGRNGGISLMKDFVLDKAVLSEDEKQEILTARQGLGAAQNKNSSRTLQKLSALFHLDASDWLEVDFSRWGNTGSDQEKFERLKAAVIRRRTIKIRYAGSDGAKGVRTVQPLKLVYKARAWYLKAYCMEKQDWRIFKLNRILDLEVLEERFEPRVYEGPMDDTCGEYQPVTILFSEEAAYRVYDEFDKTQIEAQPGGSLLVTAKMPEDAWLTGFLLSFGTQAQVLSPSYLKEELAKQARMIYETYKT